jgi:hypothetical protein
VDRPAGASLHECAGNGDRLDLDYRVEPYAGSRGGRFQTLVPREPSEALTARPAGERPISGAQQAFACGGTSVSNAPIVLKKSVFE